MESGSSHSQVETASREALKGRGLLLDGALGVGEALLRLPLDLLPTLLLVVLPLHVLQLASKSLDLVLVLVDLRLVHVELGGHGLHLAGLLLQVLLVDRQLLGHLGTRLSRQQVLQLDVELFLLLDDDVLLNDLLGLLDEALLQGLDLLQHLPGVGVRALELPPSVVVQWVLQLFREGLDLEALSEELLLQVVNLLPEVADLRGLRLHDPQLGLQVGDFELQQPDVFKPLLVLHLTLCQSALEDLDLLVEECELVVPPDELRAEDVPLVDDVLVVLLQLLVLLVRLLDNVGQLLHLVLVLRDQLLRLRVLVLLRLERGLNGVDLLVGDAQVMVLVREGHVLGFDLVLKLRDLVRGDLELSLQFSHLVLCLDQVLRIQVPV